jgi:hypothetical protein
VWKRNSFYVFLIIFSPYLPVIKYLFLNILILNYIHWDPTWCNQILFTFSEYTSRTRCSVLYSSLPLIFVDDYYPRKFAIIILHAWGTRWRSCVRHCAKSRNVSGSNPDGVIGIFHWHNPSGLTTVLGSTQPVTEMSTRNISFGVKATGA